LTPGILTFQRRITPAGVLLAAVALACLLVAVIAGVEAFLAAVVVTSLAIAGLRRPQIALCATIVTIPIQAEAALTISSRTATWTKLAVLGMVLAFAARFLAGRVRLEVTGIGMALGIVVLALVASIYNAADFDAWAGEVYRWLIALVVYLIAVEATSDAKFAPAVVGAMVVSVAGASVAGIYQAFAHAGPATFQARGLTRAYSAFGEPNPFAGYLEMTVPLLFALSLAWLVPFSKGCAAKRPAGWFVGLIVGSVALGSIALILSQSRGGLLGFVAGISTVMLLNGGWTRYAVIAASAVLILFVALPPLGPNLRDAFISGVGNPTTTTQVTVENWAAQERISHWRAGLSMWSRYPILGVGAGNYSEHYREETKIWRFRIPRGHAHNAYIQAAAQSGIVGLAAYVTLMVAAIVRLARKLSEAGTESRSLVIGAIGVTVSVIVHGFFDYLHVLSLGLQLSIVWAAIEIVGRSYTPRWPRQEALACRS
jgi:O-antigen ligase